MNRSIGHISLLWLFLMTFPFFVGAQGDEEELEDEIVTVGEWQPKVKEAVKIRRSPTLFDSIPPEPKTEYRNIPRRYITEYHVKPIKAARLRIKEPLDELRKGYLKGGVGTFTTPYGEAYFSSDRDKEIQFSGKIKHISSEGGVRGNEHADWSTNQGHLRGKFLGREKLWKGELDYQRDVVHHYGFPDDLDTLSELSDEDIEQRFQSFGGNITWESYHEDSADLDHDVNLAYYHFRDHFGSTENNIDLDAHLEKYLKEEHFFLDVGFVHNNFQFEEPFTQGSTDLMNYSIIGLTPGIISQGEKYEVKVGLRVQSEIRENTYFHFYPNAEAKYTLFDGIFIPYAGIKGGLKRNTYKSFARENPFILSNLPIRNTNNKYNLYGGIRGSISSNMNFDLRAIKRKVEGLPLYVNDSLYSLGNRFGVVYDTGEVITLKGDLSYYRGEKFKFHLTGAYHRYRLNDQVEAWHRPLFELGFNGWYDLADKFTVKAGLKYMAARKALSRKKVDGAEEILGKYSVTLDPFLDANLGFEYRYTTRLSAFLNLNNLIGARYQKWYHYQAQGFQVLGGLTYSL